MTSGEEPRQNAHGQPVGRALPGWSPPPFPAVGVLRGRSCRVEALAPEHTDDLYRELCGPEDESRWTYLGDGPFDDPVRFSEGILSVLRDPDVAAVVVREAEGVACGLARLMRVDRPNGVVEVRRAQRALAAGRPPPRVLLRGQVDPDGQRQRLADFRG